MSLALARKRATKVQTQVEVRLDPVVERRKEAGIPTFKEAAAFVFAEHKASWKNQKHPAQPETARRVRPRIDMVIDWAIGKDTGQRLCRLRR